MKGNGMDIEGLGMLDLFAMSALVGLVQKESATFEQDACDAYCVARCMMKKHEKAVAESKAETDDVKTRAQLVVANLLGAEPFIKDREYTVGKTVVLSNGIVVKCVEEPSCKNCVCGGVHPDDDTTPTCVQMKCDPKVRKDGKNVVFEIIGRLW